MIKLHTTDINIGTNLDYIDSLTDTILNSIDLGIYTLSFNLGNSRNHTRKRVEMEDLVTCMGLNARFPMMIFSIIPSMYNLCGNQKFLAWNGNDNQDSKTTHMIREIEYELQTLSKLGGNAVIELGSYRNKKSGLDAVVKSINNINFKLGYSLVLINSLDNYHNIGIELKDLQTVYNKVDKHSKQYLHIGLNIAYLYVNGLYDLRQVSEVERLFIDYDALFSNKFALIVMILTDCSNTFKSKEYDYESIGYGELWSNNDDALYTLIIECQSRNISIITKDVQDMELIRYMTE